MQFDLKKMLRDVFDPQRNETVLVMVDEPHGKIQDNADWTDRRKMADEWRTAFAELGLASCNLLTYKATGASNSDLPEHGRLEGKAVSIEDTLDRTNIAVAMTQYSATAPLVAFTERMPRLRAASMPGVLRRMESTALAADYSLVAKKAHVLADLLNDATQAQVVFSTGHKCLFDLRHRLGKADDGICRRNKKGHRVINLPSGEAFIVPYEGERTKDPSRTEGEIPMERDGQSVLLKIKANRIGGIEGEGKLADFLRRHFGADAARCNVAELGLGCNDAAVVSGSVLEDEKVGFHWAYGRSEHLGGTVGPAAFKSPENVLHHDIVYARGCPIGIQTLSLAYPDREIEVIMRDNEYCIF